MKLEPDVGGASAPATMEEKVWKRAAEVPKWDLSVEGPVAYKGKCTTCIAVGVGALEAQARGDSS
eukprot:SAG11_NODE_1647_length_4512_cov_6.823929_3_plen_65_part_00